MLTMANFDTNTILLVLPFRRIAQLIDMAMVVYSHFVVTYYL